MIDLVRAYGVRRFVAEAVAFIVCLVLLWGSLYVAVTP